MASRVPRSGQQVARSVRPVVSQTPEEARARVLAHYKAWQRNLPFVWHHQQLKDYPLAKFRLVIKNEFLKHAHVTDLRVIDRLIIQGEKEIEHFQDGITNTEHVRNTLFKENFPKQPTDFLGKFFHGKD